MVISNPSVEPRPPRSQSVVKSPKGPSTAHPVRARAASSGRATSSGRGRILPYGGTRGVQMEDTTMALPFTVILSAPSEPLMEVSSSPFDTSSGSGSMPGGPDTPPDGNVMQQAAYNSRYLYAHNTAASGRPMHLHK